MITPFVKARWAGHKSPCLTCPEYSNVYHQTLTGSHSQKLKKCGLNFLSKNLLFFFVCFVFVFYVAGIWVQSLELAEQASVKKLNQLQSFFSFCFVLLLVISISKAVGMPTEQAVNDKKSSFSILLVLFLTFFLSSYTSPPLCFELDKSLSV
jgi:glycerol uptake facilitator-like aquaporin